jgi:hypothetical protein
MHSSVVVPQNRDVGTQNPAKKRVLGVKSALFGPKTGQNQGFAVTDSSTV